jgi:hypothetical protein
VLALLDEVPGVAGSRVDWTGRRFLLELEPRARAEAIVPEARKALGGDVRRLEPEEELAAIASYRRGEPWMRSGETVELSRTEARLLAQRHGTDAARAIGLDAQQTARWIAVIEGEIAAEFERIHAAGRGLPADQGELFAGIGERSLAKSRAFLSEEEAEKLATYVRQVLWTRPARKDGAPDAGGKPD